jgi:AcrR family transcriptional regulator
MARKTNRVRWSMAVPGREEQFRLKRHALILEAGKSFGKKGYHNTSLDEVAKALNVTKPALYYYIRTKQEILFECHAYALELGEQARVAAWAASDEPLERLRLLLSNYIRLLTGSFGSHAALAEPISSLDPRFRNEIRSRLKAFGRVFEKLIKEAIADRSLPESDPKMAINYFMGAINNISRWFSPAGSKSGAEIADIFVNFTMNGLRGQHAPSKAVAKTARRKAAPKVAKSRKLVAGRQQK